EPHRVTAIAGLVHEEHASVAHGLGRGAEHSGHLARSVASVAAAHDDRMELAIEDRRDDGSGDDARGRDADYELGVVFARHLQRECSRELPEEWPLDVENALGGLGRGPTGGHGGDPSMCPPVGWTLAALCATARPWRERNLVGPGNRWKRVSAAHCIRCRSRCRARAYDHSAM